MRTIAPFKRKSIRFWEKQKIWRDSDLEVINQREKQYANCSICGKVSHYHVMLVGFCEGHRAEAYAAQAAWFAKNAGAIYAAYL